MGSSASLYVVVGSEGIQHPVHARRSPVARDSSSFEDLCRCSEFRATSASPRRHRGSPRPDDFRHRRKTTPEPSFSMKRALRAMPSSRRSRRTNSVSACAGKRRFGGCELSCRLILDICPSSDLKTTLPTLPWAWLAPRKGPSRLDDVQQAVDRGLATAVGFPILLIAHSRTGARSHALAQTARGTPVRRRAIGAAVALAGGRPPSA